MLSPARTTIPLSNGELRYVSADSVARCLKHISESHRRKLVGDAARDMLRSVDSIDENGRINAAIFLVASVPGSLKYIERVLKSDQYESHFSLFCFLDQVHDAECKSVILNMLQAHLLSVRVETAYAAWMAGDLLGDHWEELSDSVPVLINALLHARYRAGRLGALHGLEKATERSELSCETLIRIKKALSTCAATDRATAVREQAKSLLRQIRSM